MANAGGVIAYLPFLVLLLPAKVTALVGPAAVEWLGLATLVGAIAASIGNVLFGWASDRIGTRRGWASAGLVLTLASYALLHAAASPSSLIAAIAAYQLALNMMLASLAAWAADTVPDRRKGVLGGLLGAGPMLGGLAGIVVTLPILAETWMRMAAIGALIFLCVAPLLIVPAPPYPDGPADQPTSPRPARARADFAWLWCARLLVQVAGNVMFGFLFYYFLSLPAPPSPAGIARLSALAVGLGFPIALLIGARSDRLGRRRPFLVAAALAAAAGLALMAAAADLAISAAGYLLFGCASAVFLALHAGFTMQFLPSPAHRGRDLGILNLANTAPAVIAPLLAIWLVPGRGFGPLLALLTALMLLAAGCILVMRHDEQAA